MALFNTKKPKKMQYSTLRINKPDAKSKRDIPSGLWGKCKQCSKTVYSKQLDENLSICPHCNYHNMLSADKRIELLTDKDSFKEMDANMTSVDKLKFTGVAAYTDKLAASTKKTGLKDAIVCGMASIEKLPYALGVMDFRFLGASMGSVVGEKITRLTEAATAARVPLVLVTASGGARMYEGMLSLMQMAKTSGALQHHKDAGLPYIVIMTHPTYAGVTASFASLGDLILAEPGAMIGFAGPRVIRDTTQAELPPGFQTSEFLLEKGLVDKIIDRKNLNKELALCLEYFSAACKVQTCI
jgi:acetyl-CoA carboxylase carboxyl transferase subunit beta